ncbi:MAG TPA: RlmE family RNA methyltransferase [Candidatus Binatia bacterium]|nr:RlmE family RNA methyltransferase [Candidatus Binatia bacterium]
MSYNPRDSYFRKAKQEGYRSRAAYKLLELQQRFRIMKPGDSVVDLGAAPGGWLQVAAKLVGEKGRVLGVDLQPIAAFRENNIIILRGDIMSAETRKKIMALIAGRVDCVLSDLAPRLTGIRDTDTARCVELNRSALGIATTLLKPGGFFLVKSFVNDELQALTSEIEKYFNSVQRTRPDATRQRSSEFYFFARDFKDRRAE